MGVLGRRANDYVYKNSTLVAQSRHASLRPHLLVKLFDLLLFISSRIITPEARRDLQLQMCVGRTHKNVNCKMIVWLVCVYKLGPKVF